MRLITISAHGIVLQNQRSLVTPAKGDFFPSLPAVRLLGMTATNGLGV